MAIDRPDIIKVKNLKTNKISSVHTSRLRIFRHLTEMTREEIEVLASIDLDEYYVDKIVEHEEKGTPWARIPELEVQGQIGSLRARIGFLAQLDSGQRSRCVGHL